MSNFLKLIFKNLFITHIFYQYTDKNVSASLCSLNHIAYLCTRLKCIRKTSTIFCRETDTFEK